MKLFGALLVLAALSAAGIALAAAARDGAVIRNTGSTNFSGYTIKLWSDGSAAVVRSNRAGDAMAPPRAGSVPMDTVRKFFGDLKAAKDSGKVIGRTCMKSASFGSATVVQYHGWTSPDLECPGDGFVVALAAEAHEIAAALQVRRVPMHPVIRRALMPNEPRRVPQGPPVQASPSPESTPRTP